MKIYFDMDGTIADLYNVENWLVYLEDEKTLPYRKAKSLTDMRRLGKVINELQKEGHTVGIISWLCKHGSDEYNTRVVTAKQRWLERHLGAVTFNEMYIIPYGTPKHTITKIDNSCIIFDDNKKVRRDWELHGGRAFNPVGNTIIETLLTL